MILYYALNLCSEILFIKAEKYIMQSVLDISIRSIQKINDSINKNSMIEI